MVDGELMITRARDQSVVRCRAITAGRRARGENTQRRQHQPLSHQLIQIRRQIPMEGRASLPCGAQRIQGHDQGFRQGFDPHLVK